jgi:hypothetical protein
MNIILINLCFTKIFPIRLKLSILMSFYNLLCYYIQTAIMTSTICNSHQKFSRWIKMFENWPTFSYFFIQIKYSTLIQIRLNYSRISTTCKGRKRRIQQILQFLCNIKHNRIGIFQGFDNIQKIKHKLIK